MLIGALVVLAVLTVPLSHGRWSHLAAFRPRGSWLLWLALAVQIVQFSFFSLGRIDELVHVGTYLLAAAFLVANRSIPGVWLVAAGGLSNGLTIALNHGTLPARAAALREAGLQVKRTDFVNSGVMAHARLRWLGDMFAVPKGVPLANVFSVGDVLLVVGAFVVVHSLGRRQPAAVEPEPVADGSESAGAVEPASRASVVAPVLPAPRRPPGVDGVDRAPSHRPGVGQPG
jgi:Family of unknown function (DUF5317)